MSLLWAKTRADEETLSERVSRMPENIAVTKAGYAGRVHPYKDGMLDTGFIQPENYDDSEDHETARKRYEPVDDTPDLYKFIRATPHAQHIWDKVPETKVSLKQPIYATQPFVHRKHLQKYVDNPGARTYQQENEAERGVSGEGYGGSKEHPFSSTPGFVKYRNRIHVIDGHHRVSSELMKGSDSMPGKVYDADKHGLPRIQAVAHDGWKEGEDPGPPR